MAVPTVTSTTVTEISANDATPTFNMPTTRPDGDLFIFIAGKDDDPVYTSIPTHWTAIASGDGGTSGPFIASYWWTGSSEPASYTIGSDSEAHAGTILHILGSEVDLSGTPVNPIDSNSINGSGNSSNGTAPAITIQTTDALVIRAIAVDNDEVTVTPTTELYAGGSNNGAGGNGHAGFGASYEDGPTISTSTGTAAFTHAADTWASLTIGVKASIDLTAPILSSPSVGTITGVGGILTVSTDEANGTLYWMVDTNSTRTAAQVKSGGGTDSGNQSVSGTGNQVTPASTGGSNEVTYYFHAMHEDSATNQSNVTNTSFATIDDTAPVLTAPSVGTITEVGAILTVSTDEADGTLYWMVDTNATRTAAQVKTGGGIDSGNQTVSGTGAQVTPASTGGSDDTLYYFHAMHEDPHTNQSTVSSTSFTTLAAPNVLVFNSWNTALETVMLYWNKVPTINASTINTAILQGTAPTPLAFIAAVSRVYHLSGSLAAEELQGTATISPALDLENSIIFSHHQFAGGYNMSLTLNYGHATSFGYYLEDDVSLVYRRGDFQGSEPVNITVQVVEFNSGSIDMIVTGSVIMSGSLLNASNLIATGSTVSDWVLVPAGNRVEGTSAANSLADEMGRYELIDVSGDVYVEVNRGAAYSTGWDHYYYYQAIKFNTGVLNSNPQHIRVDMSASIMSSSFNSVDIDKSVILNHGNSFTPSSGEHYNYHEHYPMFEFNSATEIYTTIKSVDAETAIHHLSVVEFDPDQIVSIQTGSVTIGIAATVANATVATVDVAKSIVFVGGTNITEADRTNKSAFTAELTSTTNIAFTRYASDLVETVEIPWTLVEFT